MASSKAMVSGGASGGGGGTIDIDKLSIEQLKSIKEQSDLEFNLLQDSLNNIRTATARLENASNALNDLSVRPQGINFKLFYSNLIHFYVFCFFNGKDLIFMQVRKCWYL